MALNDADSDNSSGRQQNNNNNNNNNHQSNNNEDTASTKSHPSTDDPNGLKLRKQSLEQRKQELEKLLSEKCWLLQQIQKTETQIQNGNYEYFNLNDIFSALAQDDAHEQSSLLGNDTSSRSESAILRRRNLTYGKDQAANANINNNNNNNRNQQSEVANRSSEYDNYPQLSAALNLSDGGIAQASNAAQTAQQQQMSIQSVLKKRATPTPTPGNINFLQLHRQQHLKQAQQKQQLSPLQQQQRQQQHHYQSQQFDAISLYSINSTNVATLRQQHIVAAPQQPIIVQCDNYYLSPTHQSYNDGGFIRSSQNIKQYVASPLSSPTPTLTHYTGPYDLNTPQKYHPSYAQQQQQQVLMNPHHHNQEAQQQQLRQFDAISLAPSYGGAMDSPEHGTDKSQRSWRSQTHLPTQARQQPAYNMQYQLYATQQQQQQQADNQNPHAKDRDTKSISSDNSGTHSYLPTSPQPPPPPIPPSTTKPKPFDEISLTSVNSDTQKKSKSKQWLESSLDGPVIRTISDTYITTSPAIYPAQSQQQKLTTQKSNIRDRTKLSSQSMSAAARHYSMSNAEGRENSGKHFATIAAGGIITTAAPKLLQNDDGRYAKLSQSTSYLNTMETASISAPYILDTTVDLASFKGMPQRNPDKLLLAQQQPPPRPPPMTEKPQPALPNIKVETPTLYATTAAALSPTGAASAVPNLSPDIRIESPKNMTIVQQATFQPYKEITKPFEMSDFYKYSTKYRQKETSASTPTPGSADDGTLKSPSQEH